MIIIQGVDREKYIASSMAKMQRSVVPACASRLAVAFGWLVQRYCVGSLEVPKDQNEKLIGCPDRLTALDGQKHTENVLEWSAHSLYAIINLPTSFSAVLRAERRVSHFKLTYALMSCSVLSVVFLNARADVLAARAR